MTIPQALQLAVQHHQAGRLADAEAIYRQILAADPRHADALHLLGVLAHQAGHSKAAVHLIQQAIALSPNCATFHSNLGEAYRQMGRWDEAVAAYEGALRLKPDYAEALSNLGNALVEKGRFAEAIAACRRAVELKPAFAAAHNNLGNALRSEGEFDKAIAAYRRAIEHRPDYAEAHSNLGTALAHQGILDQALAEFRIALQLRPDDAEEHSNLLLILQYLPDLSPEEIFRDHCRWDEVHARPLAKYRKPHTNDPSAERRLRIGYVSPDFREHAVAFFLESLLASHDRQQVEVFCYADLRHADATTARFREKAAVWREITMMTDAQAADLVRQDRIDILVDLAGHTAGNRLLIFAQQPAPVQVTWLGYCDTTGLSAMDYRLTDALADPPGTTEHFHTEQLVRLPETFACFRPADEAPPVGPLPALARGQVTFASFHTLAKLNNQILANWAMILHRVPGSRLTIVPRGVDEGGSRQRLSDFFVERGIGIERLEFKGQHSLAQYLALHHDVDVLLDSHPFSGHTVSCHALWMGVPVVTLAGARHNSRMVASVLANMGLPELIAHTSEDYVRLAVELSSDLPKLAALRASLRERMAASPLLDGPRFARHVEAAYRQMWRTQCAAQGT